MDILVKGMEMPKDCNHCIFRDSWHPKCKITQNTWNFTLKGRLPNCPLVEVKAPHGRLVDADKEYEQLSEMKVEGEVFTTAVEFSKKIVQKAPTIIEAEK